MNKWIFCVFLMCLLSASLLPACQEKQTCAKAIHEITANETNVKQLAKIMNLPEKIISNPDKHHFSEADSVFLFSIYQSYKETGKVPENLYQLYDKKIRNQLLISIENFRQEELKSNENFASHLNKEIVNIQQANLTEFIDNEINSFKALRFSWKDQDEINQILKEALPKYINDLKISQIYNDSCASYINFISKFRENGVRAILSNNLGEEKLHNIGADVKGFSPQYQYETSFSDMSYQVLATIDRAQDVLFSPINWLLELLPQWLMTTIAVILLIVFIVSLVSGNFVVGIIDFICLVISIILLIWGDPYSDVRDTLHNQLSEFYESKINEELNHLDIETNKYYDNIIKNIKGTASNNRHSTASSMQSNIEKSGERSNRTGSAEINERDHRRGIKENHQIVNKTDSCI